MLLSLSLFDIVSVTVLISLETAEVQSYSLMLSNTSLKPYSTRAFLYLVLWTSKRGVLHRQQYLPHFIQL